MNTLAMEIEQLNCELSSQLPKEMLDAFGHSIEDLKTKNIGQNSIQIGEVEAELDEYELDATGAA